MAIHHKAFHVHFAVSGWSNEEDFHTSASQFVQGGLLGGFAHGGIGQQADMDLFSGRKKTKCINQVGVGDIELGDIHTASGRP